LKVPKKWRRVSKKAARWEKTRAEVSFVQRPLRKKRIRLGGASGRNRRIGRETIYDRGKAVLTFLTNRKDYKTSVEKGRGRGASLGEPS